MTKPTDPNGFELQDDGTVTSSSPDSESKTTCSKCGRTDVTNWNGKGLCITCTRDEVLPISEVERAANYLYSLDEELSPALLSSISTLRQLINEEFVGKDGSPVSNQFIYTILKPGVEAHSLRAQNSLLNELEREFVVTSDRQYVEVLQAKRKQLEATKEAL